MSRTPSAASRWIGSLFALPFAGVGIGMLFLLLIPTIYDWARMQTWEAVPAQLIEARLERQYDETTTYRARARYRYQFQGTTYTGERVAIGGRSDNIGDFQEQLGYRLEGALRRGEAVTAWVNPDAPHEAVLERSLRPALLIFYLAFVVMFGGFGLGFIWFLWRTPPARALPPALAAQPWLARPEWADNRIRSDKRAEVYVAWGITLFASLMSAPLLFTQGPKLLDRITPGPLIAMIFPLASLGLLVWAIRATRDMRRFGEVRLQLDPFPGAIGGHVGGSLVLRTPHDAAHRYRVTLSCIHHYVSRSGGDSDNEERLLWQADGQAQTAYTSEGSRLSFRFDVPDGLAPSSEPDRDSAYIGWRVEVDSEPATPRFARRFSIPVYTTGQQARALRQDSAHAPAAQAEREAALDDLLDLAHTPEGFVLRLPYFRNAGESLGWVALGLLFSGVGIGARMLGAPLIFPIMFCLFGLPLTGFGLWALTNSLRVCIDRNGLLTERRWLGWRVARHSARRADIRHLALKELYRTRTGARHSTTFRLVAVLVDGRSITLADMLRGQSLAEALLTRMARETGLDHAPR